RATRLARGPVAGARHRSGAVRMRALRIPVAILGVALLGWLGWTIVQVTRADELAHDHPEAALRIDPNHPQALLRLARKQLDTKQYDAAMATARHLLSVEPGQGDAFTIIALAAVGRGDDNSEALMRIALQRAPRDLDVRTQAMVAALQKGDLAEGMKQLDAMLRLSPKRGQFLYPAMAQQAMDSAFAAALVATLARNPPWRRSFLASLGGKGTPEAVDHVYAGLEAQGALSEPEIKRWLDRKLRDNQWGEAYALWTGTLDPRPDRLPAVYNGSFEQDPTSIGFDWQKTNTKGVFSALEPASGAGDTRAAHFRSIGPPPAGGDLRQRRLLAPG